MSEKRGWDVGTGAVVTILLVVILLGAAGYGIARYTQHQREKRQAGLQGLLNYQAASGNVVEVQSLLRAGASPNGLSREGHTALHGAAMMGQKQIVRLLLDAGADPNLHRSDTSAPVYEASQGTAFRDHPAILEMLLEAGADPNGRSPSEIEMSVGPEKFKVSDQTALMRAMISRQDEILRLLLKHGADPNLVDSAGKTALHWWVFMRRNDRTALGLGPLLVRKGADPRKADGKGKTPLDYARELGDRRLLEMLVKAAAIRERKAAAHVKPKPR